MWGVWLLTFGLIYSAMSNIPHTAYMASLAPPLGALSGAGIVLCWRWYRAGDRRGWAAPVAVAAVVAWAWYLWSGYPGFLPWARWAALLGGLAAVVVLTGARLSGRARGRLALAGLAAGVAAMLIAPVTWAGSVLDVKYAGSSFDASAGPSGGFGIRLGSIRLASGEFPRRFGNTLPGGGFPGGGSPGGAFPGGTGQRGTGASGTGASGTGAARAMGGGSGGGIQASAATTLSGTEQRIYRYVTAHRGGASYLMAVQSWSEASPYILATGQEVLPMGGFSGTVPEPTPARVQQLVRSRQLRFFLLGGGSGAGPDGGSGSQAQHIASWVRSSCSAVPAKDYLGTSVAVSGSGTSGGTGAFPGSGGFSSEDAGSGTLYVCGKSA